MVAEDQLRTVTVISPGFLGRLPLMMVCNHIKVVVDMLELFLVIELRVALSVQLATESECCQSIKSQD